MSEKPKILNELKKPKPTFTEYVKSVPLSRIVELNKLPNSIHNDLIACFALLSLCIEYEFDDSITPNIDWIQDRIELQTSIRNLLVSSKTDPIVLRVPLKLCMEENNALLRDMISLWPKGEGKLTENNRKKIAENISAIKDLLLQLRYWYEHPVEFAPLFHIEYIQETLLEVPIYKGQL